MELNPLLVLWSAQQLPSSDSTTSGRWRLGSEPVLNLASTRLPNCCGGDTFRRSPDTLQEAWLEEDAADGL